MSDFEQTPPRTLGLNIEQVQYAANNGVLIRFWPERDAPCQPHVGRIDVWRASAVPFSDAVKLTVSLGYVRNAPASHCEFAEGE